MDSELELIDLGDAKEQTKGIYTMMPREESPAFPYGDIPPPNAA
jgi:hypothetical protein